MSFISRVSKFCNENLVLMAGIPIIVGIHWGWYKLQQNPVLVPEKDKKDLPIIIAARHVTERLKEEFTKLTTSTEDNTMKKVQ